MGQFLGQHFLSDETVLEDIAAEVCKLRDRYGLTKCIEIGPGGGALTKYLIPEFEEKVLFEMDERLEKGLKKIKDDKTSIVWGDVLKGDISGYDGYLVVGNLPYYITSPIFRKFFVDTQDFMGGVFLIQKEVGEKASTNARKKSYLWRLVNYYFTIEYCFTVDKSAFTPPPKVQSALVSFTKRKSVPSVTLKRVQGFLDIVSQFSRKTLGRIFKMRSEELGNNMYILPDHLKSKRLEELGREEMEIICGEGL